MKQRVEEAVRSTYGTLLQYVDTKGDRDSVKVILAKITSLMFMTKLANAQNRSFQHSQGIVDRNLHLLEEMTQEIRARMHKQHLLV